MSKISERPLVSAVTGNEKIPTGEVGDKTISPNQIITKASETLATIASVVAGLATKQNSLGYTPEDTANKATDLGTINDTKFPTVDALFDERTVTTSDSIVQTDNGKLIIFNSVTGINFTIDLLTVKTKVSFLNIGAGTVTFVTGTATPSGVSSIAGGSNLTAMIIYHVAATPLIVSAGSSITPAALTKTDDTNVILSLGGTPTTALLQAASITVGWTGTLAASRGGTGSSAGAWALAGTSTLSAAATIANTTPSGLTFTNTYTTTASDQYANAFGGTITPRATANDNVYGAVFNYAIDQKANGQSLIGVQIAPSLTNAGGFSLTGSFIIPLMIGTKTAGLHLRTNSITSATALSFGSSNSTLITMAAGGATVELNSSSTNTTHALVIVNNAQTSNGGGILYLKGTIGNSAPNAGQNFYGVNSDGAIQSNWANASNFFGSSYRNSFAPTATASTLTIFDSKPTINCTSTFSGTLTAFNHNPTLTSVTGLTHYGILIVPTACLNGFGTATPTAVVDVAASSTARASMRIRSGTAPTSPNEGDFWYDGTNLKFKDATTSRTITWT